MCMLIYFLKKKGSIHIVHSARCLFILFLCFIIYTFTLSGLHLSSYISPFLVCFFYFTFYHEELHLSKEKQCYLFVILLCKYKSSSSCKLHSLSCIKPACFCPQMFMSHIRKCMFRLCVYLLGYINISIILCTYIFFCLQLY